MQATARLKLAHAGPLCSWQDGGRPGLMRYGVPCSGPMDRAAFALAHAALGNPPGGAVIEISPGGLVLDCLDGEVSFALTGGAFAAALGRARLAPWTVAGLRAGDRLSIRPGAWGSWACLAFAGRPVVPQWLGSAATHAPSGLGGGMLASGDVIEIAGAARRIAREGDLVPPPWVAPPREVRVVLGPQERFFAAETLAALTASPFTLGQAYDRMGVRLAGPALPVSGPLDMPSGPVPRGSVQVAGDGVATVLLADHQTTGGYPRIATVIGCDLDRFVQLRSGDRIRFTPVSPAEALALARQAASDLASELQALAAPRLPLAERLARFNLTSGVVSAREG